MKHMRALALLGLTCLLGSCGSSGSACENTLESASYDWEELSTSEESLVTSRPTREIVDSDYKFERGDFSIKVQFIVWFPGVDPSKIPWKIGLTLALYNSKQECVYCQTSKQKWCDLINKNGKEVKVFIADYWTGVYSVLKKVKYYNFGVEGRICTD